MAPLVRRVVTGHDGAGNPVFTSDGPPPHAVDIPGGPAVADLWSLDRAPESPDDGYDPEGGFPIEPPPGGMWWRLIRIPLPDQDLPREQQFLHRDDDPLFSSDRPGMHATSTIDLVVIVDGEIELEVEDGCVRLGRGDCVVQRGTQHRWRVVGSGPCTYAVALFALDDAAVPVDLGLVPRRHDTGGAGPRRVVAGLDGDGRSIIVSDGPAPSSHRFLHGGAQADLWHTGGALHDVLQGGDVDPVSMQLDPLGMGITWKYVELLPSSLRPRDLDPEAMRAEMASIAPGMMTTGHHDPADPGMHRTDTIDLDLILDGELELALPGAGSVQLGAGDVVVQRGTWHKWTTRGDRPARMLAIMIGAPIGGRKR